MRQRRSPLQDRVIGAHAQICLSLVGVLRPRVDRSLERQSRNQVDGDYLHCDESADYKDDGSGMSGRSASLPE
jgi:hypothetical protein